MRSALPSEVVVVGGGGIGGTVAGELALVGCEVSVVDTDEEHVAAIQRHGLTVHTPDGHARTVAVDARLPGDWSGAAGLVVLAVKSAQRDAAVASIAPRLARDGLVAVLQNGWNAERVAERLGADRTLAAMVHLVGTLDRPGHVTRHTTGTLHLGAARAGSVPVERVDATAAVLDRAVPTTPVADVWGYIWSKQVWGATMPVNALVDQPAALTYRPTWVRRILLAVIVEGIRAARSAGVTLRAYERFDPAAFDLDAHRPWAFYEPLLPRGSAKGNSGVWRDLRVHRRRTEVEHLTGELVRIGRSHGLAMDLNTRIALLVADIEDGRRSMGWANLRELSAPAEAVLATLPGLDA